MRWGVARLDDKGKDIMTKLRKFAGDFKLLPETSKKPQLRRKTFLLRKY